MLNQTFKRIVTRSSSKHQEPRESSESEESSYEEAERTIMTAKEDEVSLMREQMEDLRTQLEVINAVVATEKQERQRLEALLNERQQEEAASIPVRSTSPTATSSVVTVANSETSRHVTVTSSTASTISSSNFYGFPDSRSTQMSYSPYSWPPAPVPLSQPGRTFPVSAVDYMRCGSANGSSIPTFLPSLGLQGVDHQRYVYQQTASSTLPTPNLTQPSTLPQPQLAFLQAQTAPLPSQLNQQASQSIGFGSHRKLHDLPEFHGKPEEWPMFCMAFLESTGMFNYSRVENMFRLQKSIKGDARDVVESLLIHPDNVDQVMSQLEFRFGRPECLVQSQLTKIREIMQIPEHKLDMVIPFATKVQNLTVFLEASGMRHHLANPTLLDELVGKLPMSKRLEWAQVSVNILPHASIKDFNEWLNRMARLICIITTTSLSSTTQGKDESKPKSGSILHAIESSPSTNVNQRCRYCKEPPHPVVQCDVFKKLDNPEKWQFVKRNRLCFGCLKFGHNLRVCRTRKTCGIDDCVKMHHQSLHQTEVQPESEKNVVQNSLLNCNNDGERTILFRVLPVRLFNGDSVVRTYALLDEGSSVTIMSSDLAKRLQLNGRPKDLSLRWFGRETITEKSSVIDVLISGDQTDAERFEMCKVQTVADLCLPTQTLAAKDVKLLADMGIPLTGYTNASPEILIGLDNCHLGVPIETVRVVEDGPIITKTKLGWVAYGKSAFELGNDEKKGILLCRCQSAEQDHRLNVIIDEYFRIDNFGVQKPTQRLVSEADKRALRILTTTTVRLENRYRTGLLWKEENPRLPRSYQLAKRRLICLEAKMRKEPEFATAYKKNITNYIEKGYARKLTSVEAMVDAPRTWYLPHFGVKNPNKPGKIRLVFDAAAEVNGVSLNSFLLKGPDDYRPLVAVLLNFRLRSIAVIGDIREMFHQVLIQPEDQHSQRFLWRENEDQQIDVYVMEAMTFGASCSPCIANFIKNHNASRFSTEEPKAVEAIIDHHYVDDYVHSFDNVDEAIEVTNAVIRIHRAGGFELRNVTSNSEEVTRKVCNHTNEHQKQTIDMNIDAASSTEKVLGMCWDNMEDVFVFRSKFPRISQAIMEQDRCPTKREFLSITMSTFDPFGMIANFMLYLKLLLRSIWSFGIEWDDPIPNELFERWRQWKAELPMLTQLRIPRCHSSFLTCADRIDLHTFVDASEDAFSAVTYIRAEYKGQAYVSFVCGKTRGSPRKLVSIPRLELSAAILGVRLCNSMVDSHKIQFASCVFWSDSKTVLHWLRTDPRRHKEFVAFRIAEILESSHVNQWRWIPSKQNPADEATRTKYPPKFDVRNKWINGPSFLKFSEEEWPKTPEDLAIYECQDELRPRYVLHADRFKDPFFDPTRFSTYLKLQRSIAWLLRFVAGCRKNDTPRGELNIFELQEAERVICRQIQRDAYSVDIDMLSQNARVSKDSSIYRLSPYLDNNGLLRVLGRIDAASTVPFETKRPIILPTSHKVTDLIIERFHRRCAHQYDDTVVNEIRQKFWVHGLRNAVKRVRNRCQLCRIRNAKPVPPMMGQLPEDRLTPNVRPFTYTGLDYFGPINVAIGRRREKRWIALFTCLTVRAVHLEIATDLSTDACILCIRNFVNRRGIPLRIRSDNGTNFVGANNELMTSNIFDNEDLKVELSSKGIEWVFNCPGNPHAGGCWERLVQSIKRVLSRILSETTPKIDTLQSMLIEAENIVNSRPLTHLPVMNEDEEPLTPNHFIIGGPNSTQTPGPIDARALCLRKQWQVSQQLKDRFWRRWISEYLPVLTRRCKWFDMVPPLKIGDLVLVCDVDAPRSQWTRGIISNVFPGRDGQVRCAEIKTSTGLMRRPAVKLAKLEVGEISE